MIRKVIIGVTTWTKFSKIKEAFLTVVSRDRKQVKHLRKMMMKKKRRRLGKRLSKNPLLVFMS